MARFMSTARTAPMCRTIKIDLHNSYTTAVFAETGLGLSKLECKVLR